MNNKLFGDEKKHLVSKVHLVDDEVIEKLLSFLYLDSEVFKSFPI